MPRAVGRIVGWARQATRRRGGEYSIEGWRESARQLLKLWVVRSSEKLRGSVSSWTTEHYYKNTP